MKIDIHHEHLSIISVIKYVIFFLLSPLMFLTMRILAMRSALDAKCDTEKIKNTLKI